MQLTAEEITLQYCQVFKLVFKSHVDLTPVIIAVDDFNNDVRSWDNVLYVTPQRSISDTVEIFIQIRSFPYGMSDDDLFARTYEATAQLRRVCDMLPNSQLVVTDPNLVAGSGRTEYATVNCYWSFQHSSEAASEFHSSIVGGAPDIPVALAIGPDTDTAEFLAQHF